MLKCFAAIFYGVLIQFVAANSKSTSCTGLNPFLKTLTSRGVTVFDSPLNKTDSKCGEEWASHGTCCEIGSLRSYALKDSEKIQNLTNTTVNGVFLVVRNFLEVLDYIQGLKNVSSHLPLSAIQEQLFNTSLESTRDFLPRSRRQPQTLSLRSQTAGLS